VIPDPEEQLARRSSRFLGIAAVAVVLAIGTGWAIGKLRTGNAQSSAARPDGSGSPTNESQLPQTTQRGELLFGMYCSSCHGSDGRGDGPSAVTLHPPPRDFAVRPWRFPITKESIRTVILDGIPGTAMASSRAALTAADVDAIVDYVFHLASSRPSVVAELTENEKLLRDAGFFDMGGIGPPPLMVGDAAGKEVELSGFKGRLVLIHFWGTNCPHCLKEMPHLKTLEDNLKDRAFSVLHICTDAEDVKDAQIQADQVAPGLQIFAEASGLGLIRFEVQALPSVWLIAPDGKVIGRSQGARDWSAPGLRRLIEYWLPHDESRR